MENFFAAHRSLLQARHNQAVWLIMDLFKGVDNTVEKPAFITFRAMFMPRPAPASEKSGMTKKPKQTVVYNENIPITGFMDQWNNNLCSKLQMLNTRQENPCNIHVGINPRNTANGNEKKHVSAIHALNLDLDVTAEYTLEDRYAQIKWMNAQDWFPIVTFSGHGLQALFPLASPTDIETGERLNKLIIKRAGCKDGGNTCDCTRLLRLPGTLNQKYWFDNDSPLCEIVIPNDYLIRGDFWNVTHPDRNIEDFEKFPLCDKATIRKIIVSGADIHTAIATLAQEANDNLGALSNIMSEKAKALAEEALSEQNEKNATDPHADWAPTLTTIPDTDLIEWPKACRWMKKYCKVGYNNLTAKEIDDFRKKMAIKPDADFSASLLDYRVIRTLIIRGYTFEAVQEFWHRPDVQLHRAEKAKDYLHRTYTAALKAILAAKKQEETDSVNLNTIVMKESSTYMVKDGEEKQLFNAAISLVAVYEDKDALNIKDKYHYEVELAMGSATSEAGLTTERLVIDEEAFSNILHWKKQTGGRLCVFTSKDVDLQYLKYYLLNAQKTTHKAYKYTSKLHYDGNAFDFPAWSAGPDGIAIKMDDTLKERLKAHGHPTIDWYVSDVVSEAEAMEQLKKYWPVLISCHKETLIHAILGQMAASIVRQMFYKKLKITDFSIPTINVRGNPASGKTFTVKRLMTLFGYPFQTDNAGYLGCSVTKFCLERFLTAANFLPFALDEFKMQEGNYTQYQKDLKDVARKAYSGENVYRGTKDQKQVSYKITCPIIVIGEHEFETHGDIAEMSRLFPVITNGYQTSTLEARANKKLLEHLNLSCVAPYFYQWLSKQDPNIFYDFYQKSNDLTFEYLHKYLDNAGSRISHNIAALQMGVFVVDQFAQAMIPGAPSLNPQHFNANFVEYYKNWTKDSGFMTMVKTTQDVVTEEGETSQVEVVKRVSHNEAIEFLRVFFEMLSINEKTITEAMEHVFIAKPNVYKERNPPDSFFLKLESAYPLVSQYCQKIRRSVAPMRTVRDLFRQAHDEKLPWIVPQKQNGYQKPININGNTCRAYEFSLRALRQILPSLPEPSTGEGNANSRPAREVCTDPTSL